MRQGDEGVVVGFGPGTSAIVCGSPHVFPPSVLRRHTVESLTVDERCALMDRAASRFDGTKREMLVSAKAHFLAMMET